MAKKNKSEPVVTDVAEEKAEAKADDKPKRKAKKADKSEWAFVTRRLVPTGQPLSFGWGQDGVPGKGELAQFMLTDPKTGQPTLVSGKVVKVEDLGNDRYDVWVEAEL